MAYYLYSETAFLHEGDVEYAKKLIHKSKELGLNGIKFQVLTDLDYLISTKHSAYSPIKKMTFQYEQWKKILLECKKVDLDIVFMPINPDALSLIEEIEGVAYLDIHSVSFYDMPTLERIKESGQNIILGLGGRTVDEIHEKISFFGEQLKVLMVGFQSFPSKLEDIRLEKVAKLKSIFPDLTIGYADHSGYGHENAVFSNDLAFALGARFFEKHLTLEEGVEREDYESAVGPEKMAEIKTRLDYLHDKVFSFNAEEQLQLGEAEIVYRNRERVAVAKKDLVKGSILGSDDFCFKMIDKPNGLSRESQLVGKTLISNIQRDDIISSKTII